MKIHRLLPLLAVVALLSPAVLASELSKYKDWPSSPQGYFMTGAERSEWKANVKTDSDAEAFINKFIASRGPGFVEDVAKRADAADQHLTVAHKAGSRTLRGKIVILLGPPSAFTISGRELPTARSSSLGGITGGGASEGGSFGRGNSVGATGSSVSDMVDASNQSNMSLTRVNDYNFTYASDKLPVKRSTALQVVVEVNPLDGSDKINDRRQAAMLEELFDAAAAARLAATSAPVKP
jgi:GWxTD domain-containing protein